MAPSDEPASQQPWMPYATAFVAIVLCVGLRMLFQPWLGSSVPYLFFFPAILGVALHSGFRGGIATTALSTVAAAFFFMQPLLSLRVTGSHDLVSMPLFVGIGWAISHMAETRRRFERGYQDAATLAQRHARELEAANQRLNEIVANVPGVVWEAWGEPDASTQRIDFVSQYVRDMLGYDPGEWTAVPNFWLTVVHPDDRERAAAEARAIYTGEGAGRSEFRWVHRDGRVIWVEAHSMVVRDDAGRPAGMRGVTLDITERKHLQQDLSGLLRREQHAREEAVRANRLKDDFLATLSHELRTPLNAVLGYVHMLRHGGVAPEQRDHALMAVERNAAALAQMVSDVLDVSRIAAGKIRLNVDAVDVAAVVSEAINTVRPAADAKGVVLDVTIASYPPPLPADPDRLQQIVWNLLSNAVRFTPRDGRVHVAVAREASSVIVTVSDTGIGITPDFLPCVFDRFRQADNRVAREHGGLGLGLAITRELVELHGGTISATSDGPGRGATFRVVLPCQV